MDGRFSRILLLQFVLVAAITLIGAYSASANTLLFSDDFNRPDGAVGNGWTTWWGPTVGSPDIVIENGQLKTFGWGDYAGGIFRPLSVDFPIGFSFRFRTEEPPSPTVNGGWQIMFNADSGSHPNYSKSQVRFYQYFGWDGVSRAYTTDSNVMNYEAHTPAAPGQRAFRSDTMATISGLINPDLSSMITVTYNDSASPESVSFSFEAPSNPASIAPGNLFVLGNAEWNYGPHYFDDVQIWRIDSNSPVPEPGSLLVLGSGLMGLLPLLRRKK